MNFCGLAWKETSNTVSMGKAAFQILIPIDLQTGDV
jgi:hypothetical protein